MGTSLLMAIIWVASLSPVIYGMVMSVITRSHFIQALRCPFNIVLTACISCTGNHGSVPLLNGMCLGRSNGDEGVGFKVDFSGCGVRFCEITFGLENAQSEDRKQ